ncbi:hypothetical protein HPB52_020732 [Rhipicephalus sanguineus]|uniref:Sodium/calcium exchanger membrane region domain-containing protein n=1 Tax=Rhipicephalus sanguineus TaxID=34632 RepID=A0A9D4PXH8_RHISA|nr:hypothetical protein HPB52_020732 [Rhipicephalus sanguineus]
MKPLLYLSFVPFLFFLLLSHVTSGAASSGLLRCCPKCDRVHHLNLSQQCDFVYGNEECHSDEQYLAYTTFVYCAFGSGQTVPGLVVLTLGLLVMFVGLGITADDFDATAVVSLCSRSQLSPFGVTLDFGLTAPKGVTFLAFGNGAPDILSSLAGIQQARPELVIGELFGAGIFVTCVVAGSVYLTQDFNVMERPFLRDVIFYISATFWAFYLFYTQQITIAHSIGFIMLYILFILVVVFGRLVYQRMSKDDQEKTPVAKAGAVVEAPKGLLQKLKEGLFTTRDVSGNVAGDQQKKCGMFKCAPEEHEGVILRRFSFRESTSHRPRRRTMSGVNLHHHRRNSIYIITAGEGEREARVRSRTRSGSAGRRSRASSVASTDRRGPRPAKSDSFRVENGELAPPLPLPSPPPFLSLDPLTNGTKATAPVPAGPESVTELTVPMSIPAPIYFILTVTTPVVDYENDKHNWCRLLNSLHCVLSPVFITLVATGGDDTVSGVPVVVIVALGFACVAGTVFATSSYDNPPRYHWVFGYVGFWWPSPGSTFSPTRSSRCSRYVYILCVTSWAY